MYRYRNKDVLYSNGSFELTKHEALFSVIIIAIMLIIGIMIHGKINNRLVNDYQKYNTALHIQNDTDLFLYAMKTNVGNAFVYGDLEAVDTVTYPEIGGKYIYVEKVKEKYTRHTRRVKSGKTWHTQVYHSWDRVGSEDIKCKEISFCDVVFDSNKIEIPDTEYIDTIKESSHIRYKYYGVSQKHTGTIFAYLENKTIKDKASFYENKTIEESIKHLESKMELVIFWLIWIVVIAVVVYAFCYIDNRWLED